MKENTEVEEVILHSEHPYDMQWIKELPLDKRIDKVIDILEIIQNKAFYSSNIPYHKIMSKLLEH